jgi:hypothetical protein
MRGNELDAVELLRFDFTSSDALEQSLIFYTGGFGSSLNRIVVFKTFHETPGG